LPQAHWLRFGRFAARSPSATPSSGSSGEPGETKSQKRTGPQLCVVLGTKPLSSRKLASPPQITACYLPQTHLASFRKVCQSIPLATPKPHKRTGALLAWCLQPSL
jgi:hypothetical protein